MQPMKLDEGQLKPSRPAYVCSVCGEVFDHGDLGHCPECDHHYPPGDWCGNCHRHKIRKTMRRAGFTVREYLKAFDNRDRTAEAAEAAREKMEMRQMDREQRQRDKELKAAKKLFGHQHQS